MSVSASSSSGNSAAGAGLSTVVAPDRLASRNASMTASSGISSWASTTRAGGIESTDDRAVGAGHDDDRVLAVVADRDQRPAGRETVDDADPGVVDPVVARAPAAAAPPASSVPSAPTKRGRGAGAGGGDRLVEALAPGVFGVRATEHGLAGRRRAGGGGDEIEVGAADHADVEHRRDRAGSTGR